MPPPPGPPRSPRRRLPVAAAAALLVLTAACGTTPTLPGPGPTATATSAAPSPGAGAGTTTCEYPAGAAAAKPVQAPPTTGVPATGTVRYTLEMTGGPVTLVLDRAKAPCTVNSFVSLAEQRYFDGSRCHRLADSGIFVLQCGDPTGSGRGGPGYTFADETTGRDTYVRGVVAMANGGPDTNGSQFFLVWDDSTAVLDANPAYTVFGRMEQASRDVVAQMAGEGQDGSNPDGTGRPNNPSEISTATKAR